MGVGVWVCGCVGVWVWVCGCVGVKACGCVCVFVCDLFGLCWLVRLFACLLACSLA